MKLILQDSVSGRKLLTTIMPILVLAAAAAAGLVVWGRPLLNLLAQPDQIKALIAGQGFWGILLFLAFQVLQIVVAIIPGEPIQIAGGYLFGTFTGFALSTVGIMIGSVIAFLIAKSFGLPVVRLFVKEQTLTQYKSKLESRRSLALLALLCLLPGIPKDVLVYAAGLTPIRFGLFFIVYFFGRLPALFVSSYMGAQLDQNNWPLFAALGLGAALLLALSYLLRDRIAKFLNIQPEERKNVEC